MKAAIGNTLLMSLMVTFITTVLLILISSIVYTKAFRIKNRIVDVIEKYEKYDDSAKDEIAPMLSNIGYIANDYSNNSKCNNPRYGKEKDLVNASDLFHYCVFELDSAKGGYYYKVVTFAYLDIPFINAIQIPVYGETRIFYSKEQTTEP